MVSTSRLGQLGNNFSFPAANGQPILVKTNLFERERQSIDDLFDFRPQCIYQIYFPLPSFLAQLLERSPPYGLAETSHIDLAMDDGYVDTNEAKIV